MLVLDIQLLVEILKHVVDKRLLLDETSTDMAVRRIFDVVMVMQDRLLGEDPSSINYFEILLQYEVFSSLLVSLILLTVR